MIPQLDIPDVGRNHILKFFLAQVRKTNSVQEIYSDSLFKSKQEYCMYVILLSKFALPKNRT